MFTNKPLTLTGTVVQLEEMQESHRQDLFDAAQDESIWAFNTVKACGDKFHVWFDKAMQGRNNKQQMPFVVRDLTSNKIIGSTRFYDISNEHKRLTIGYTWYIPKAWGTTVNPECKFLLLKFAFETLELNRVEFVTDSRNARSRAAIKKLGATEEGILRQHMALEDGYIRDTVIFSIIKNEWLAIKNNLVKRCI